MTRQIAPFHAMAIGRLAHALAGEGRSVIHMEYGQPSTGAPAAAIAAAHRILDSEAMGYWESAPLKERIARHYAEAEGVGITPGQVILTCGASPALVLALTSAFEPGARVALARPGYVAYRNTLAALSMEPVEIGCGPAERYQLSAAALAALDPAPDGVIIASPANPTGTIIPPAELAAIAAVCRARGIRILSDEIYHGLSYGLPTVSMLAYDPTALIINSFSKYYSMAGWRLGWLIVPNELIEPATARMSNMLLTPPSLSQHAGLIAFDCREEVEGHIATYAANRAALLAALPDLGLASIAPPDGAFYIWADIAHLLDGNPDVGDGITDSLAFCTRLLEDTGVATAPGIDFDPEEGWRFFRLSFAVSREETREAIARMVPWFAERRKRAAVMATGPFAQKG